MNLITGGTGFLGSYLLYGLLKAGYPVRATYRAHNTLKQCKTVFRFLASDNNESFKTAWKRMENVEWVKADLLNVQSLQEAMEGVKTVYHAAGRVSYSTSRTKEILNINIRGTANMVNAAIAKGAERFHYVSSVAALDRKPGKAVDEKPTQFKKQFNSVYEESKYRAEREVWRGFAEGLEGVVVNPAIILGAGDISYNSGQIFEKVRNGIPVYPAGAHAYVDARDVSRCLLGLSGKKEAFGHRFILASETWKLKDVMDFIADEFGITKPRFKISPFPLLVLAYILRAGSFLFRMEPLITPGLARYSSRSYFYNNDRVKEMLQFNFLPLQKTIEDICRFYLHQM